MAREGPLVPDALLERVARRFRVLGDANRLVILRLLVERGPQNVGEVVEALGMSQANVSKHLRQLLDAGLVSRRAEGTMAYYQVVDPTVEQLCSVVCGRIADQLRQEVTAVRRR